MRYFVGQLSRTSNSVYFGNPEGPNHHVAEFSGPVSGRLARQYAEMMNAADPPLLVPDQDPPPDTIADPVVVEPPKTKRADGWEVAISRSFALDILAALSSGCVFVRSEMCRRLRAVME